MDLTTVARVKALLGAKQQAPSSAIDTELGVIISAISSQVEKYLNRKVETTEYTEYFSPIKGQKVISLSAYPHITITSISNDTARVYTSSTLASTEYWVDEETGLIHLETAATPGPGAIRVQYTGGMTDPAVTDEVASFIELYPDIARAVDLNVVYLWQRQQAPGATSISIGDGSISHVGAYDLLPGVITILDPYRREV